MKPFNLSKQANDAPSLPVETSAEVYARRVLVNRFLVCHPRNWYAVFAQPSTFLRRAAVDVILELPYLRVENAQLDMRKRPWLIVPLSGVVVVRLGVGVHN